MSNRPFSLAKPGEDFMTERAAKDKPEFLLTISIVVPGLPFDGDTIKEKSLGGSETATVCMARELAARGHHVTVWSSLPEEQPEGGVFDEVRYSPVQYAQEAVSKMPMDVLIVQRHPEFFTSINSACKLHFLWNHDLATPQARQAHAAALWNMDRIFVLSDYMKEQYQQTYPFIPEHVYCRTRNGIDLGWFPEPGSVSKVSKKIMYSARPERGLGNLLDPGGIMDMLYELDPEIHLYICGYDNPVAHLASMYQYFDERAEALPNVTKLGFLQKRELYQHYAEAELYAYPTPHPGTMFREISCISAMECMAAGTPFVTTALGALPETLGKETSVLLEAEPEQPNYRKLFAEKVFHLLNEGHADLAKMRQACYDRAPRFSWTDVALQWEQEWYSMFREASKEPKLLAHHFFYHEDMIHAKQVADKHKLPVAKQIEDEYGWCFDEEEHKAKYANFAKFEWKDRVEDHVALHYDQVFSQEPRWRETQGWFERMGIPKGARILDVGCGCGYFSVGLANLGYNVVGFDVAPEYVKQAIKLMAARWNGTENGGSVLFCDADNKNLWAKDKYDVIYIAEILEHLAYIEPQDFVKQFEPYLKDDGHFLITTPFGPLRRAVSKDSGHHHEFHVRHIEKMDIEEYFGQKDDFQATVLYWQHTETTKELCGWYLYSFGKGGEYGRLNERRKLTVQVPRNRLSVCMIAANEEANIRRCLNSIHEVADEILLLDTGCTDRTMQIAKEFGAIVRKGPNPLEKGFETSRNESIRHAQGEWILWIDADEELQHGDHLVKYLRHFGPMDSYRIKQHHFTCQPPQSYKIDKPSRVFRNKKDIRFWGYIHEHPEYAVNQGCGPNAELMDVDIAHTGYYTEAKRRKKFWRNLPLLHRDREAHPERILGKYLYMRDLIHLAQWELESTGGVITERARVFAEDVVQIFHNSFLAMGGHMAWEALQYYSAGLRVLGRGFDIRWTMGVGLQGEVPPMRVGRFATKEHFLEFLAKTLGDGSGS
jgi:glycosyltransferase involved in cell wall biosynthesis/2-polyprenyl-3-methyl-5-hydroxy-6-metoxy-1,4-benzoquinol methylase